MRSKYINFKNIELNLFYKIIFLVKESFLAQCVSFLNYFSYQTMFKYYWLMSVISNCYTYFKSLKGSILLSRGAR